MDGDEFQHTVSRMVLTADALQIDQQTESIAQLRRESQQWKEQFMRVEEERTRLSKRIEEMVSEQLSVSTLSTVVHSPLAKSDLYPGESPGSIPARTSDSALSRTRLVVC